MNMLLAMIPTILLTAYSQLITKWRVTHLMAGQTEAVSGVQRIIHYLSDPYIISSYAASLLSSIAWLYVIEKYAISLAFPAYMGLQFCMVILFSAWLLHEVISAQQLVGVSLILAGIVLVSRA